MVLIESILSLLEHIGYLNFYFLFYILLFALFYLGGEVINSFAGALIVGVIIGTYSSIYVASSMILALGISKEDMLPSEKEKKEIDARP